MKKRRVDKTFWETFIRLFSRVLESSTTVKETVMGTSFMAFVGIFMRNVMNTKWRLDQNYMISDGLGLLAGQEVPHHLLLSSLTSFLILCFTLDFFHLTYAHFHKMKKAHTFGLRNGLWMAFFHGQISRWFQKVA